MDKFQTTDEHEQVPKDVCVQGLQQPLALWHCKD